MYAMFEGMACKNNAQAQRRKDIEKPKSQETPAAPTPPTVNQGGDDNAIPPVEENQPQPTPELDEETVRLVAEAAKLKKMVKELSEKDAEEEVAKVARKPSREEDRKRRRRVADAALAHKLVEQAKILEEVQNDQPSSSDFEIEEDDDEDDNITIRAWLSKTRIGVKGYTAKSATTLEAPVRPLTQEPTPPSEAVKNKSSRKKWSVDMENQALLIKAKQAEKLKKKKEEQRKAKLAFAQIEKRNEELRRKEEEEKKKREEDALYDDSFLEDSDEEQNLQIPKTIHPKKQLEAKKVKKGQKKETDP